MKKTHVDNKSVRNRGLASVLPLRDSNDIKVMLKEVPHHSQQTCCTDLSLPKENLVKVQMT